MPAKLNKNADARSIIVWYGEPSLIFFDSQVAFDSSDHIAE